jgi:type IV fimbrial biogenesis protein FimT
LKNITPMSMKNYGFTLIELMAVLTIAAIVLTLGVPSFQEIVRNNRFATQANRLMGSINLARSEAVKRGVRVTLCKSRDGVTCASSNGYEQGWIVFSDPDENAVFDNGDTSNEEIIRVVGPTSGGMAIEATSSSVADYISYVSEGWSTLVDGGFQLGTIELCMAGTSQGRQIVISGVGRARVEKATCS